MSWICLSINNKKLFSSNVENALRGLGCTWGNGGERGRRGVRVGGGGGTRFTSRCVR